MADECFPYSRTETYCGWHIFPSWWQIRSPRLQNGTQVCISYSVWMLGSTLNNNCLPDKILLLLHKIAVEKCKIIHNLLSDNCNNLQFMTSYMTRITGIHLYCFGLKWIWNVGRRVREVWESKKDLLRETGNQVVQQLAEATAAMAPSTKLTETSIVTQAVSLCALQVFSSSDNHEYCVYFD